MRLCNLQSVTSFSVEKKNFPLDSDLNTLGMSHISYFPDKCIFKVPPRKFQILKAVWRQLSRPLYPELNPCRVLSTFPKCSLGKVSIWFLSAISCPVKAHLLVLEHHARNSQVTCRNQWNVLLGAAGFPGFLGETKRCTVLPTQNSRCTALTSTDIVGSKGLIPAGLKPQLCP